MNVALVGLGYWGPNLLRTFDSLGVLHSAFDFDFDKLLKYADSYKHVGFGVDHTEILDDPEIDALVIATPPDTHYRIAKQALEHGKHVFVEKPLTLSSSEAIELNSLAISLNRVLFVGHIFLYSPEIIKLKEIVMSEDFGDIQYIYLKRLNLGKLQEPANVIEDLAPHDISILDFILEKSCTEVQAIAKSHVLTTEDVAFINVKYDEVS